LIFIKAFVPSTEIEKIKISDFKHFCPSACLARTLLLWLCIPGEIYRVPSADHRFSSFQYSEGAVLGRYLFRLPPRDAMSATLGVEGTGASTNPLHRILALRSVNAHFQPIVSVGRKALIGVEALARASDPATGNPVPAPALFEWARAESRLLELDRLCHMQALRSFATLPPRDPELLLFLNIEASLLDQYPSLSILELVREAGVRASSVVIEINETHILEQRFLADFVERHRRLGFLIAMDDLGSGHSSLQRWPVLKPDIIKLDRGIVDGIAGSYFSKELLRSVVALGRHTGALVLAEGVETHNDITACLDMGVDLFQGFFFARPAPAGSGHLDQALHMALACATSHKGRSLERMAQRRGEYMRHSAQAVEFAQKLSLSALGSFDEVLSGLPSQAMVESIVVLDEQGIQQTHVVFTDGRAHSNRGALFQPSKPGTNHSDRDYFYGLTECGRGRDFFLTDPNLSVASGLLCRTLSHVFRHTSGASFIVCLDLLISSASKERP
jgi:EAL domain-containing protein (putative c-di-GMP-specific phosphodiesterase class I)